METPKALLTVFFKYFYSLLPWLAFISLWLLSVRVLCAVWCHFLRLIKMLRLPVTKTTESSPSDPDLQSTSVTSD